MRVSVTIYVDAHLDDEASALLEAYAAEHGLSHRDALAKLLDEDDQIPGRMGNAFAGSILRLKYRTGVASDH